MTVSEKEIVDRLHPSSHTLLLLPLTIDVNPFFVVAKIAIVFVAVLFATAARPKMGNRKANIGVYSGKQPLVQWSTKNTLKDVVAAILIAHAVTMTNEEQFPSNLHHLRFFVHYNTNLFFQVIKQPHIMVAYKEMELNPSVGHLCHLSQQAYKATGNCMLVGEPEVKDITQHDDTFCFWLDTVKPADDIFLALQSIVSAS